MLLLDHDVALRLDVPSVAGNGFALVGEDLLALLLMLTARAGVAGEVGREMT